MALQARRRLYWSCQIVGWSVYAAVGLMFVVLYMPGPPLGRFVAIYAGAAAIAVGCTHVYRGWLRRQGWVRLPLGRAWWRILAASAVVGIIIPVLVSGLYPLLVPQLSFTSNLSWIFPVIYVWIAAVFGWNVLYFAIHYLDQYREAEVRALQVSVAAKDVELRALLAQLNPHFLFNCLNSLRALISEDPERAQTMVTELSSLLRYALASERRPTVTLAEEMEAVEAYLKLEGIRLEERLQITRDLAPAALAATVPTLLVQTLVENAIKHGVALEPGGGWIRIQAGVGGGRLAIEVSNSGRLEPGHGSTSIGLANARQRLRLLYGENAQLLLAVDGPQSVRAEARLPVEQPAREGAVR